MVLLARLEAVVTPGLAALLVQAAKQGVAGTRALEACRGQAVTVV